MDSRSSRLAILSLLVVACAKTAPAPQTAPVPMQVVDQSQLNPAAQARADGGKPAFVNRLFDAGANYYDGVFEWGFLRSGSFYRRSAQARHGLKPGDHVLDVACGTGLMAVEATKILGTAENITCLDPSEGMLRIWPYLGVLIFGVAIVAAVPWISTGFLAR